MINWSVIIPVAILLVLLLLLIIIRNRRDRKDLENKLNEDYRKPRETEGESDTGDDTRP